MFPHRMYRSTLSETEATEANCWKYHYDCGVCCLWSSSEVTPSENFWKPKKPTTFSKKIHKSTSFLLWNDFFQKCFGKWHFSLIKRTVFFSELQMFVCKGFGQGQCRIHDEQKSASPALAVCNVENKNALYFFNVCPKRKISLGETICSVLFHLKTLESRDYPSVSCDDKMSPCLATAGIPWGIS